jgi:hypothetical protein
LDLDHQLRLVEFDAQPVALSGELGNLPRIDAGGDVHLGTASLGCEGSQVGGLALAPPGAQGR